MCLYVCVYVTFRNIQKIYKYVCMFAFSYKNRKKKTLVENSPE